ncbi:UDP-glycosyltransferase 83A1 [Ziziphus jujuba]|uniref:UDP-glycosyltransferase 83A1 n=1 Tax=Ziziphus jujuba TaxID=326968 RepID=A0A6P3ZJ21_ZIZJJ|nr:UDP-glycosyltransferase 83A1 [Ziziphus jujuba]
MGRTGASTSHHVLVIPFPVQGHVNPLMLFSHKLALQGFKVSFLNTDFNHKRVLSAMALCDDGKSPVGSKNISLVSIPDGLSPDDDRTDMALLCEAILDNMPAKLEELLTNFNALSDGDDDKKITCVIADGNMGWAMEVATKMGIRGAIFWPAAAATFVMELNIQRMINEGLIDSSGFQTNKKQKLHLSQGLPAMDASNFPWSCTGDSTSQKTIFHYVERFVEASKLTDWWLFNTAYDVEPAAISLYPRILPIGPLLASQSLGELGAQFWREDHSCLNWLDKQKPSSVIYVSFGSLTVHDETQINALALGLELTGRPFLWVVRPGMIKSRNDSNPNGFLKSRGKIVSWVPQQKVLSHPAIACFVSHCGWNSTLEGLSNGLPFLCWPYFVDQFFNMSYICDIWKVGLGFERNEKGIISGEEVKKKVEQVLGDESIRARSLQLKELAMKNIAKDGQS